MLILVVNLTGPRINEKTPLSSWVQERLTEGEDPPRAAALWRQPCQPSSPGESICSAAAISSHPSLKSLGGLSLSLCSVQTATVKQGSQSNRSLLQFPHCKNPVPLETRIQLDTKTKYFRLVKSPPVRPG